MKKKDVPAAADAPAARKKRLPFPLRLLRAVLLLLAVLLVALGAYLVYSLCDRRAPLAFLPPDYSVCARTSSAWDAVEPLLDLRAADLLLSSKEFSSFRPAFMELRASPLRSSKWARRLASRPVDVGLYLDGSGGQQFLAVVRMGVLSAATRAAGWYVPHLRLKELSGLSYVQGAGTSCFEYHDGDAVYYIKPFHDLLLVTQSRDLLERALLGGHDLGYTPAERDLLAADDGQPVRIVARAQDLARAFAEGNPVLEQVSALLSPDTLSVVSFGMTDKEVSLAANVPLSEDGSRNPALHRLFSQDSSVPQLVSRTSALAQYYTVLNAGSLPELVEAAFTLIPPAMNAQGVWNTASRMCRTFFSLPLDELLYSWTGRELAVLGIDGQNAPVFAVQVADEQQRQEVFGKITSSILVRDDTSLILDGVRLPRLELPPFLAGLLSLFGITLPSPYYLVFDGYVYFSESPESLSTVYTSITAGKRIAQNEYWQEVSGQQRSDAALSLFYNLERSVPFFLRGRGAVSQALQLYPTGRLDVRVKERVLSFQLTAVSRRAGDLRSIPGFPVALGGLAAPELQFQSDAVHKRGMVFWTEDARVVKALDTASMEVSGRTMDEPCTIVAAAAPAREGAEGLLWAVTAQGAVYLLDSRLESPGGFPVALGAAPSARASVAEDGRLVVPCEDGTLRFVAADGSVRTVSLPLSGSVRAAPAVLGSTVAVYDKSFRGRLLVLPEGDGGAVLSADVPGIAFGSPALLAEGGARYMAFVTQAGAATIWTLGTDGIRAHRTVQLDGVFYAGMVASGRFFYALSADSRLFRLGTDGSVLQVAIPLASAKEGLLTAADPDGSGIHNVYVSIDGNQLYGFNSSLELLSGYPVAGWGAPVFTDVNGDNAADCFALTLDRKLNAWNVR